jgi:membrane protein required for colicin V production
MHPADAVILGIIAVSMLFGVFRGLVREAFSLAGWFAAYLVARLFHAPLEQMLVDVITTPSVRLLVAWGGLFLGTLLLAFITGYMVMSLMDAAGLRGIDRFFGAFFGLLRGLILVLALLVMAAPFVAKDAWWREARLPREFMRYERQGRELRSQLYKAAQEAGQQAGKEATAANPLDPAQEQPGEQGNDRQP